MCKMNAWKRLMEQDALKGQTIEKEKKTKEDTGKSRGRLKSEDEFLVCRPKKTLDKEERQKIINSVKLTKALVLLGYSCWSQVEPG